jgi:hypothetical protein
MIKTRSKCPWYSSRWTPPHAYAPSLDEITDAMLTSKHPEILSALWNIDKDANPELDKFRVALKGFDTVSCQFAVHYLFKATILWIDSSTTSLTTTVGGPSSNDVRRGHCGYTAEEESGKIPEQVGDLIVWNIERVYEEPYTEGRSGLSMYTSRRSDRFYASIWSAKTLTQRLKSQGFELVETEMFGDAQASTG